MTAPLALSPGYSGNEDGRRKLWASIEPHGRPIRAAPPPCLTSSAPWSAHLGVWWDLYLWYVSPCFSSPILPPNCTPRGLFYRKLSARPLLLCIRLRMGPLLSLIHTSLAAAKTESTLSPITATAQSNSILSLSVCSLPLYSVCILEQRNIIWRNLTGKKTQRRWGLKQPDYNFIWIIDAAKPSPEYRGELWRITGSSTVRSHSYFQDLYTYFRFCEVQEDF